MNELFLGITELFCGAFGMGFIIACFIIKKH